VYNEVFEQQRPAALFLRPDHDRRLIERVRTDPQWRDYYHDANCHIFINLHHALANREVPGPLPVRPASQPQA